MNWKSAVGALTLVAVLAGCSAHTAGKADPPVPRAAPRGLAEVTPAQFVAFRPVVNRYFHYRKQAVIKGNIEELHRAFPDLKQGPELRAAINAESDVVARYKWLGAIDGNIDPESYARFKVSESGDKAVVLVNGTELYLGKNFEESGGQLQILLYLERRDGAWTVVKTDETTDAEYHEALH